MTGFSRKAPEAVGERGWPLAALVLVFQSINRKFRMLGGGSAHEPVAVGSPLVLAGAGAVLLVFVCPSERLGSF